MQREQSDALVCLVDIEALSDRKWLTLVSNLPVAWHHQGALVDVGELVNNSLGADGGRIFIGAGAEMRIALRWAPAIGPEEES